MKKEISPAVFIAVILVLVVVVGVFALRSWVSPAGSTANVGIVKARGAMAGSGPTGPSPEQLKQIQEWKKQNPGAYTRY